jgi:hypothetical protein
MTGGKSLKPMAKLGARETAVAADLAYQAAKPSVRSMQPRLHPTSAAEQLALLAGDTDDEAQEPALTEQAVPAPARQP